MVNATNNGHTRRLDRITQKLSPNRPSIDALGAEYDRLIALWQALEAGDPSVGLITPKWPYADMDRWVNELIEEGSA